MKSPLLYLLETLFCSGVLLAFYRWMLLRKVSFAACRRYLVGASLLALLLPALRIPLYPAPETAPAGRVQAVGAVSPDAAAGRAGGAEWSDGAGRLAAGQPSASGEGPRMGVPAYLSGIGTSAGLRTAAGIGYGVVAGWLAALFAVRVVRIRRLRRKARLTPCDGYLLAEHASVRTPFSFLRTIFLGEGYEGRRREVVLLHEASHIRHRHSRERIVLEAVRCLQWFNPFVWMAGRALEEVQEWEADREVLDAGCDLNEYRMLILQQLFGCHPEIACGLNHSLTKNRFLMMTRSSVHRHAAWRLGALLPVVAAMMLLCSFTVREPERPDGLSTVHVPQTGEVRMNGEERPLEELTQFVGEERERLAEEGLADKRRVRFTFERDSTKSLSVVDIALPAAGGLLLDGRAVTMEELKTRLAALRDAGWLAVRISADDDVRMGRVTDLKELLRGLRIYRVQYASTAGGEGLTRMLPPDLHPAGADEPSPRGAVTASPPTKVVPSEDPRCPDRVEYRIKARNLYLVNLNRQGRTLAGTGRHLARRDAEQLTADIKAFLGNPTDSDERSEQTEQTCNLPDGRSLRCRQSQGWVALTCDAETSYGDYMKAQRAIAAAFDELRNELARSGFDRVYGALSLQERRAVATAVPLRISEAEPHKSNRLNLL